MADSVNSNNGSGHIRKITTTKATMHRYDATVPVANVDIDTLQDRRKRAKGKGKAGKLAALMNVPLDVIFEASSSFVPRLTQAFLHHTGKFDLSVITRS